jgi:tRNA (guanine-N7-)-methyltransferase
MLPVHSERDLRSFGRRRGRKLSARQAALLEHGLPPLAISLSQPSPVELERLFAPPVAEVWLEIGFGGAEHLIWQAHAHPRVGLIGCEPFADGVVKALSAIKQAELANVRLYADDARLLLRWLPAASIARTFILFPDPWPKKRHHKRRLVSRAMLTELARVMRSGGELRIATDVADYTRAILLAATQQQSFRWTAAGAGDWRERGIDWPPTRYERKALLEGRRCTYFRFRRS